MPTAGSRVARFARTTGVVALLGWAASASGATLQVLVDADNNASTGCTVALPGGGTFTGVEQRFTTTVDTTTNPPHVTGVTREDCNVSSGSFAAPVMTSPGGWNVGVGDGMSGANVIETSLPFPTANGLVRLGFLYVDPAIGSDGIVAAAGGGPIVAALASDAAPIPTLSPAMTLLLALLVVGGGYAWMRRHGVPAAPLAIVVLALTATLAWAVVLDGLVDDWAGSSPVATNPGSSAPDGASMVAVFLKAEAPTLFVRADVHTGMPPTASADSYTATPGATLSIGSGTGLLANDTLGVPAATVSSFGGGTLGGAVTDHAAGSTATFGSGGSLTVNADGSLTFAAPATFAGSFTFSYRIANLNATSDAPVTITARGPPAFTSAASATFVVGTAGTFTLTATGQPAPTFTLTSGTLPSGVMLNATTGVLSGMPAAGTSGTYPVTFTASNGVTPNATQAFTLTVNQAPAITSAASTAFALNQAGTFTVTTTGLPTNASMSISETGALPAGVTFTNNGNGTAALAGTPTASGVFPITITASNGVTPNATQAFTLTVNTGPTITSANATTFKAGSAGTFTVTTSGTPGGAAMAITESGALPSGVTFLNNGNGTATLAGMPAGGTGGTYPITITAANGITPNATQSFTLTVQQAPAITSAATASFSLNQAGTFSVTTTGFPTNASMSITETGALPAGVTLTNNNNGTATLGGTPTAQGTFPVTITASNGVTPNATQSFTLTVSAAPAITSANNATFKAGTAGTFTVTTTGTPSGAAMAITETGALPSGVTLVNNNDGTATLAGMPGATSGGTYPITITAANGVTPNATQAFTLTVQQAPAITSAAAATFSLNQAGTFSVTTTGFPTNASMTISQTGALPAGVSFTNNGNGTATLAGTPTAQGSFPITITASNGVTPNATQSFTLTVNAPPAITSANNTTFKVGTAGTFSVTTTGTPGGAAMTISETGPLPSGVSFVNNGNGTATLAGMPASGTGGTYPITITAANGVTPNATQSFTLTVQQAPAITSAATATFILNQAGTFTVTTTGFPTNASMSITETGALPAGVSFTNNGNGTATIAGTPTAQGSFPVTITASNGVTPNATQSFTLTVNAAPAITSANATTFKVGSAGTFGVTTTGTPGGAAMIISETGALPSGVGFVNNNDGTATLAGMPAAGTGGTYSFTVTAANGVTPNATQSFTLTVQQAPAITSGASVPFSLNQPGTFTVTTTGFPTNASMSITETGALPAGVSLTNNGNGTATLAGTPTAQGTFPITITAANGVTPNATQSFTLTVNAAAAITSSNAATFTTGSAGTFTVTTTGTPGGAAMIISETGALPSGVLFVNNNDGTATLAGTPGVGTGGTYPFTVTANNGVSPAATQAFTLTVQQAPAITSIANTMFVSGQAGTFTVTTTGVPTAATISQTGALPAGVTFTNNGNGTATLAGTTGAQGIFPITITASNGVSPNATQSFTLTVNAAPVITSANNATLKVGTAGAFSVTTTGTPSGAAMVIGETGALPSGVGFTNNNDGTATLGGTPGAGTGGTYPITINAANGVTPGATQAFTLTVQQAPVITSATSTTFVFGQAGTFTVTTTGIPTATSISQTGALPSGVTFTNNGNGTATLAGIPGAAGSFPITITASNSVTPNATQSFTLNVNQAPSFTSAASTTFFAGLPNTFAVTTSGTPTVTSITRTGTALPAGIAFSYTGGSSATLSGTPTAPSSTSFTFTASNGTPPDASQPFTLSVTCPTIVVSPASLTNATLNLPYGPVAFSASGGSGSYVFSLGSGAPSGLAFTGASLGGTPTIAGTYTFAVTATDTASGCTGSATYNNFIVGITAANDNFGTVIGNTLVDSSLIGFTVTSNDVVSPTTTVSAFDATSVNGGTVTMVTSGASMGQFTYDPPRGYTGADSFTYTLQDGAATATATVSFTVSGRIWYVNNASSCSSSCDGRLSHPYTSLAALAAANTGSAPNIQNGDTLFIYSSGTAYSGSLTLLTNQRLMGQGYANAFSDASLPPANAQQLPAVPGSSPNVNSTITFVTGTTLRGFDMDGASAQLNGSGSTGVVVNLGRLRNTTPDAGALLAVGGSGTFDFKSVSATGSGAINATGARLLSVTGHFVVAGNDTLSPPGGTVSGFRSPGLQFSGVSTCGSVGSCGGATAVSLANMSVSGNGTNPTASATNCANLVTGDNTLCLANIYLQNVEGVSISGSTINNGAQVGINGNNVYAFALTGGSVSGNGNEAFESGVLFQNLHGTSSITGVTMSNNAAHQVYIEQTNSGAPSSPLNLSITSSNFSNAANAATLGLSAVQLSGAGGTTTLNVSNSSFSNMGANSVALLLLPGSSNGAMALGGSVQGSTFANAQAGVALEVAGSSSANFNTQNNPSFTAMNFRAIYYETLDGATGTLQGTISGNTIGNTSVAGSACSSTLCHGIEIFHSDSGALTDTSQLQVSINGNTIQQIVNGLGVRLVGGGRGGLQAKVYNNTIRQPAGSSAGGQNEAVGLDVSTVTGSNMGACLDLFSNAISEGSTTWGSGNSGFDIYLSQRFQSGTNVILPGYNNVALGSTNTTNIANYVAGKNPPATVFVDTTATGGNGFINGSCTTPP
jgi:hypothetical protein